MRTRAIIGLGAMMIGIVPAAAQVGSPTAPPGTGGSAPPTPTTSCVGLHPEATVNPYAPFVGKNHSSIKSALCHVKAGGTVTIYRNRGAPYAESIVINKANITLTAADADLGGMVEIRPKDGACAEIRRRDTSGFESRTTIRGVIFVAPAGSAKPCISVDNGALALVNSRIELADPDATAIEVGDTGSLEFTGDSYVEHGIFQRLSRAESARGGFGVKADRSPGISLTRIRVEGLAQAVDSRAETNAFDGVRFINNGGAVHIADDAITAIYAPSLNVKASRFERNGDGVALSYGQPDASAGDALPFRGAVAIAEVLFDRNQRGVSFRGAYPEKPLSLDKVKFRGNSEHALALALPEAAAATIANTEFSGNGRVIALAGGLDGDLTFNGATTISGAPSQSGVEIMSGAGSLKADLTSIGGLSPAFRFGSGFPAGRIDIAVKNKSDPKFIAFAPPSSFCAVNWDDGKNVERFGRRLADLKVSVEGSPLYKKLSKGGGLKEKDLKVAHQALCR